MKRKQIVRNKRAKELMKIEWWYSTRPFYKYYFIKRTNNEEGD